MEKLLLLHGALGSSAQMEPLADLLRDEYDVYSYDFPGHGGKKFPDEALSIKVIANSLVEFIQNNQLENCNVFGFSMGGYVAIDIQVQKSHRFNKIISLATKFKWNEEIALKEISRMNPDIIEQKLPAYAQQLAQRHLPNDWKKLMVETVSIMNELGANHLEDTDFKSIQCPVRICVGDRDDMVSIEESMHVYRQLPNGSFAVLSETAHPLEKINYLQLASEIKQFIS